MTTIGAIWHAVRDRSCCGKQANDMASCCQRAGVGADCCTEEQANVGPQWWIRGGAPAQSPSSTLPAASASHGALAAHNALREQPLMWDSALADTAKQAVQEFWAATSPTCNLAQTAGLEKKFATNGHGINTFALHGACDSCTWSNVLNSWVGEQGSAACEVAHKTTALSANAKRVGCAEKKSHDCQLNICVYDHEPSPQEALSVAAVSKVACDHSACCHSITCKNSTACDSA